MKVKTIEEEALSLPNPYQNGVLSIINNSKKIVLIEKQKIVFEQIMNCARLSSIDNQKRTIVVKGGPGTGKTVVAIKLLLKSIDENMFSSYVNKEASSIALLFKKFAKDKFKKNYLFSLLLGPDRFIETSKDYYELLICDDAQQFKDKSGLYRNKGENQIKEIIHSSKTSVFFIDENQKYTSYDLGSIDEIKKRAKQENSKLEIVELFRQFRFEGSDGYLSWLDNTLKIRDIANTTLDDIPYDFRVFDDPNKLRMAIEEKNNEDNKSRLVAGYCWEWISKKPENNCYTDINIDDLHMNWNLGKSHSPSFIGADSVNQIGCIHTTQGLEFNYVGVIVGDDLRYENNKVITDFTKRARSDNSLFGIKTLAEKNDPIALKKCDIIIRNTYRTLMTRGKKGCFVYCTDKNLYSYLKNLVKV